MTNVKFEISEEIARSYPQLRIGIIKGVGLVNGEVNNELKEMTRKAEERIRKRLMTENMAEHAHIKAWRQAYKSFGVKPKEYRPTCEALVRRVLKGEQLPTISMVVNCYFLVELEYLVPCGGYNIDKLDGSLRLRYSEGNEEFSPIGGKEIELTNPGEVVYSDNSKILTRKWNYRDCDLAKIALDTRHVILMAEAPFVEISTESLKGFLKRLSGLLTVFCRGSVKSSLVDVSDHLELKL